MSCIIHKIGDSIKWKLKNTQEDGITPIDWSGTIIICKAINKYNQNQILFEINSSTPTVNAYITVNELNIGKYEVIIKSTDLFKIGEYLVDFKYQNADGFKQSSKSITLKIVG